MSRINKRRPRRCWLCRRRAVVDHAHDWHTVSCPDCGIHTRAFPARAQAVAAWNDRA